MKLFVLNVAVRAILQQGKLFINANQDSELTIQQISFFHIETSKHRKVSTLTLYWFVFNLNVKLLKHKRILLKLTPTSFSMNLKSLLESHLADRCFTSGNFTERTESKVSKFTTI